MQAISKFLRINIFVKINKNSRYFLSIVLVVSFAIAALLILTFAHWPYLHITIQAFHLFHVFREHNWNIWLKLIFQLSLIGKKFIHTSIFSTRCARYWEYCTLSILRVRIRSDYFYSVWKYWLEQSLFCGSVIMRPRFLFIWNQINVLILFMSQCIN